MVRLVQHVLSSCWIVNGSKNLAGYLNCRQIRCECITTAVQKQQFAFKVRQPREKWMKSQNQRESTELVSQILNFKKPLQPNVNGISNSNKPNKFTTHKKTEAFTKEDPICEQKMISLINSHNVESSELLNQLLYFTDLERYPSRKTLQILCSIFASQGNAEAIHHVKKAASKYYPKEYTWMLRYDHYLAEAYWKQGYYEKATNLQIQLFHEAPAMRRKITNMTSFMMQEIFMFNHQDDYKHAIKFAKSCIELGDYTPAANLWRWCFLSTDVKARQLAEDLLRDHPQTKQSLLKKIDSIIKEAYEKSDIDILRRLVQTVLENQLKTSYEFLFGTLLSFQCETRDLKGALETFKYCNDFDVQLPTAVIRDLVELHFKHKRKIPEILLQMKYNHVVKNPAKFLW